MSAAGGPQPVSDEPHLLEVGARLLDLGNWRDLRTELLSLPAQWSREGNPAKVCVVEPHETLPGRLLEFDPKTALDLMQRGEQDAWEALDRAGWLEPLALPSGATGPSA
jgi:hypothetical protein